MHSVTGRCCLPNGEESAPTRISASWKGRASWPGSVSPWPEYVHGVVGAQGAGEDADQGEPADVGVGGRLDHLGDQGAPRVAAEGGERGAVQGGDGGERALQRGREAAGDQVEEFDGADALTGALGGGGGGEDRVEGAACDGAFQIVDECLDVDVRAVEVAVHQGLVLALGDDPFDEPVAGGGQRGPLILGGRVLRPLAAGVVEDPLGEQSGEPGQRGVPVGALGTVDGQVEREHGVGTVTAGDLAADPRHRVERGAGGVEVGDDDGARHADGGALLPDGAGGTGHGG